MPAHPETLASVSARPDWLPPPLVVKVPRDRLAQPGVKRLARLPAQLVSDFGGIHGIAAVVPWSIGNEGYQPLVRPMRRGRQHLVEQSADRGHDTEIGPLGIAADIVVLSHPCLRKDNVEGAGVVLDMEPIADVVALAIDRDRFAVQRLQYR